jgi:D-xylose reductase
MNSCELITLAAGSQLPTLGLGLWKIPQEQTSKVVESAVEAGYRHIDAACDYGNECQAGEGIQRALDRGLCTRQQLWVTSKLWNTYHRPENVRPAIERSLRDLKLEYLDLYLIHFPITLKYVPFELRYPPGWIFDPSAAQPRMEVDQVPIAETWGAMEELQRSGLCKHIGISNFCISLIRDLLCYAAIRPAVLQVESHPYLVQAKLLRYCQQEQIACTAFSPLGAGSYVELGMAQATDSVLSQPLIVELACKYSRTPAQITLRWAVQRGTAAIPKTSRIERLAENIQIYDFELDSQEMHRISLLDKNCRYNDPGVFCEPAFGRLYPIYE